MLMILSGSKTSPFLPTAHPYYSYERKIKSNTAKYHRQELSISVGAICEVFVKTLSTIYTFYAHQLFVKALFIIHTYQFALHFAGKIYKCVSCMYDEHNDDCQPKPSKPEVFMFWSQIRDCNRGIQNVSKIQLNQDHIK